MELHRRFQPSPSPMTLVSVLAMALVAALLSPAATAGADESEPRFVDVSPGAYYAQSVDWLAAEEITTGTAPDRFSPDDVVTRAQLATFLFRYSQAPSPSTSSPFGDVPSGVWFSAAVDWLSKSGVTTGTSPTTFSPDDPVTRAQMATFLWRFRGSPDASPGPFADVPAGQYYTTAVGWLAAEDITTGTSPTTFSPDDAVTRGQMATFLWRLAGEPPRDEPGLNRSTKDVVVAAADDFSVTDLDFLGSSTLQWSSGDVPAVGEIVAVGITPQTPQGFIGRVVAVSGNTVSTEHVALSEAIPEVDISIDLNDAPAASGAANGLALAGVFDDFIDAKVQCGPDLVPFKYNAELNVDTAPTFEASWGTGAGTRVFVGFDATATVKATATATAAVNCTKSELIFNKILTPIYVQIGAVPVVVFPRIHVNAEVTAGFAGSVEAVWTYTATLETGLEYLNGNWTPSYDTSSDSTFTSHNFTAVGEAALKLTPAFSLDFYGVAGPYAAMGINFTAKVQDTEPEWEVAGELTAKLGAAINVFVTQLAVDLQKTSLLKFTIARSGGDPWTVELGELESVATGAARRVDNAGAYTIQVSALPTGHIDTSALVSYDGEGNHRWSTPLSVNHPRQASLDATSNGAVVAYRQVDQVGGPRFVVARYDDNGNQLWSRTETDGWYQDVTVAVGAENHVYVMGDRATGDSSNPDFSSVVRVYDADGTSRAVVEAPAGEFQGIAAGPSGDFYAASVQYLSPGDLQSVQSVLERRTASGTLVWSRTFEGSAALWASFSYRLGVDETHVYLALLEKLSDDIHDPTRRVTVRRIDADGTVLPFDVPARTFESSVIGPLLMVDASGDVTEYLYTDQQAQLVRYSPEGDMLASSQPDGLQGIDLDIAGDGSVYAFVFNHVSRLAAPGTS